MKLNSLYKKIIAFALAIALVVAPVAGMKATSVKAADDIYADGAVYDYGTVAEYAYHYGWLAGATSEYKYMAITYTGDIANLRLQFVKGDVRDENFYWFDQTQGTHLTLVGEEPILSSEEGATVVVDIEASGINLDNFDAMDMHYGPGTLNVGYVRFSTLPDVTDADVMPEPEEPPVGDLEDIEITGFVKVWAPTIESGYEYLGGMDVNAPAGYKYLELTYKGDATAFNDFRMQVGDKTFGFGENVYDGAAVTVDGTAVPAPTAEEQTVVIDLEASGLDITKAIATIHMHQTAGNGSFEITKATLSAPKADEPVVLDPIAVAGLVKVWAPTIESGYEYLGGMDVNSPAGYKYLKLTYKGDATAFNDFRMQVGDKTFGFGENVYDGAAVTVDGTAVPAPTAEEQTVVIDLETSGLDITKSIAAIHMHQTAGNGSFEITAAELLAEYTAPVDPSTLEDIILNGDEEGKSTMIKKWTVKKPTAGDQYKYIGFATLKEPTSDYKYLVLTYTGDIASIRWEFATVDEAGNETAKTSPYWFNKEGQELYFVTADGSDIPLDGGKGTTIVIDLEATGIDLGTYNSVHMHAGYGAEAKDIEFQIGMARLSTKADLNAALDVMPVEPPTTTEAPTTTVAPTTVAPTTTAPTVDEVTVKKTKVKKATKKLAANKAKVSIKKVKGAAGYKVQFSTTKKFKKVLAKKVVNTAKATIKSKKIKNVKKLFVRVKAYKLVDGKKVWAKKWSKAVKVKVK